MAKLDFKKQSTFFDKNYTRIAYYELDGDKEIMLGNGTSPRCRFCGEDSPAFFKEKAHVVPHFIGNRALKSLYECDKCNAKFCEMESHFSNYMALYHVLSRIGRGNKKPVYKNNSKSKIVVEEDRTDFYMHTGDENLKVDINKEEKTWTVNGVRSYIPIYVYKIFIKMALSIMPESEMQYLRTSLNWLMTENAAYPNIILSMRMYEDWDAYNGACMIYKRKSNFIENAPTYLFGLTYNNFFFQTFIPLCSQDIHLFKKIDMPHLIPCHLDKAGLGYKEERPNLSVPIKISKGKVSLKFDVGGSMDVAADFDV